jgi:hypothetical protein
MTQCFDVKGEYFKTPGEVLLKSDWSIVGKQACELHWQPREFVQIGQYMLCLNDEENREEIDTVH